MLGTNERTINPSIHHKKRMEAKEEAVDLSTRSVFPQFRENMRAMQFRIKNRFRVAMTSRSFLRHKARRPRGLVQVPGTPAMRATATGFVVARVFQDNVIFARVARSLAKQEWQKSVAWVSSLRPTSVIPTSVSSRFWSVLGYSAAGGSYVYAEHHQQPAAQAEALVLGPRPAAVGAVYKPEVEDALSAKKRARKAKAAYYEGMWPYWRHFQLRRQFGYWNGPGIGSSG